MFGMSRVVVVKHASGKSGERLNADQYRQLLMIGFSRLFGGKSLVDKIRNLLPEGAVGLKTNCLTGKFNSTPVPLIDALTGILEEAGWGSNDIVIWERTSRELKAAGFKLNASGFGRRCFGTDANNIGYGRRFHTFGDSSSLISNILEQAVAGNINLPVLKDHSIAGLSGGMKNMFGAINNPNKFHGNCCDPHVAEVSMMEPIRIKNRLTIMDATRVQYHNGPGYDPACIEGYGSIMISTDPVAVDAVGYAVIERLRKQKELPSLEQAKRPARYLRTAQELGLGTADMKSIDLQVITVDDKGRSKPGDLF